MSAADALEQFYRADRARVLAWLIRMVRDFDLAEDALQDASAVALTQWSSSVPDNPAAWIATAARRKALDRLRRRDTRARKADEVKALTRIEQSIQREPAMPEAIPDERLRLLFTCCHPALAPEARIALTLRTLCGLSTPEIARAFLVPQPTMAQRLVRAKHKIRAAGIPYVVPEPAQLDGRLQAVLAVIYLVFNEGYNATTGDTLVRDDLTEEALRLGRILTELMPASAEARGLLALMLLTDSRRAARADVDGVLVTLEDQDRSLWDAQAIEVGRAELQRALRTGPPGPYQVQAAISAVHADAARAEDTDWEQIVGLYDALLTWSPTTVVALNRAAAVAMAFGAEHGLTLLDDPALAEPLARYLPFHAARADLLRRAGRTGEAAVAYQTAVALAGNHAERTYLERRLAEALG